MSCEGDRRDPRGGRALRLAILVVVTLAAWTLAALTAVSGAVVLSSCVLECTPLSMRSRLTGCALVTFAGLVASAPFVTAGVLWKWADWLVRGAVFTSLVLAVAFCIAVTFG